METIAFTPHTTFTTIEQGLNRQSPVMRLYEKAKRLGVWNPSDIDFSQDVADWQTLSDLERDVILRLTAQFQAGEEAVTLDLLPLIMVIAQEGRLEEEMFLTTFLFEEAKHTDFFRRFLDEVAQVNEDLSHYHPPSYRQIFYEALPSNLQRLIHDHSPAAQVRASVTYNMIVEGMLAETGYHAYFLMLKSRNLMPGQQKGITLLKQDESRHIAYAIFLLSRLIAADDSLWQVLEDTMNTLLEPALNIITESLLVYEIIPFGITIEMLADYALAQYQKRMDRLERARGASLDEIYRVTKQVIDEDDG